MLTLNTNWKAAFSQSGVDPIVHVKILDLKTYSLNVTATSGSKTVTVNTSTGVQGLVSGMTILAVGIPAGTHITSIDEPSNTPPTATTIQISNAATSTATGTATIGKVYQMVTSNSNQEAASGANYSDPVVLGIVPITANLDHWERKFQIGELSIVCQDEGILRELGTSVYSTVILKNKIVEVKVGSSELDFTDYVDIFRGRINDISTGDGILTLKVRDILQDVLSGTVQKPWGGQHPLQVMKQSLENSGIATTDIDSTSFDPDDSSNDDISHYTITA